MKKTIKSIMAFAMTICLSIMVGCSGIGQPSPEEVMDKINSREKLEMEDYETILDYVEEFVEVGEASPNNYESGQEVARAYP